MSTRIFLGVKAAGEWGWRPYHLHAPSVKKSVSLNFLDPSRPRRPVTGILYLTTLPCRLSRNLGSSPSWRSQGLSMPVMGLPDLIWCPTETQIIILRRTRYRFVGLDKNIILKWIIEKCDVTLWSVMRTNEHENLSSTKARFFNQLW